MATALNVILAKASICQAMHALGNVGLRLSIFHMLIMPLVPVQHVLIIALHAKMILIASHALLIIFFIQILSLANLDAKKIMVIFSQDLYVIHALQDA